MRTDFGCMLLLIDEVFNQKKMTWRRNKTSVNCGLREFLNPLDVRTSNSMHWPTFRSLQSIFTCKLSCAGHRLITIFFCCRQEGPWFFLIFFCKTQLFQNISVDNGPISSPRGHQQSGLEQVPRPWPGDQVEPKMALSFRFSYSTDQTFFSL